MNTEDLLKRVAELIQMGSDVLSTKRPLQGSILFQVAEGPIRGFRTASLSFIQKTYGSEHPHFVEFSKHVNGTFDSDAEVGLSILKVIREEISGGWLTSLKTLVTAEVFADFVEMAEHLLGAGYKDAAAVIAGGVLEEGLRQLCRRSGVEVDQEIEGKLVPKKADRLNADLAKVDAYNRLDQKAVSAWLDLRNKAAHGRYPEYESAQVDLMIKGIADFLARRTVNGRA